MIDFQGSGFSVEVPETCEDASAYTFLLPTPPDGGFTPYMTVQSEKADCDDLEALVREKYASLESALEKFSLDSFVAGRHEDLDVVLATIEWGPSATRMAQIQAYYLVTGEVRNKIYCLTGTDLMSNFDQSRPVFNRVFRSFRPNDIQVLGQKSE
jgi:hypothetical protein